MIFCTYQNEVLQPSLGLVDRHVGHLLELQEGHRRLKGHAAPALASMLSLIDADDAGRALAAQVAASGDTPRVPLASAKLLAPLPRPRQMRCFSVFQEHLQVAAEKSAALRRRLSGEPEPAPSTPQTAVTTTATPGPSTPGTIYRQPRFYFTNRFNIVGPDAVIQGPNKGAWLDWELEIGVVIGRGGRDIQAEAAAGHIFGYTILNDWTARDQVLRDMDLRMGPTKGKSFDTGMSMGPWIVTPDEVPDIPSIRSEVRLNGEVVARPRAGSMLFSVEDMVVHASRDETLHAGECMACGTLGGGSGFEIERWPQPGDVLALEVDALGTLTNRIAAA